MRQKILLILMFFLGVGIFCFPLYSNWYNNRIQYSMLDDYQGYLDNLKLEEIEQKIEEARQFNQALLDGSAAYVDPFSDEQIKKAGSLNYPEDFEYGKVVGSIEIQKIDVKLPILVGVSDAVLAKGVGYLPNTSLPIGGESIHTVLTGHRGLATAEMFRNLNLLEVGDVFYVNSLDQTLAYEVDQIKIVEPHQIEDLRIELGKDYTTLITCDPYMVNSHRLLVRGHRVEYVEIAEITGTNMFFERYKEYIYTAVALSIIFVVAGIQKRRKGKKYHD